MAAEEGSAVCDSRPGVWSPCISRASSTGTAHSTPTLAPVRALLLAHVPHTTHAHLPADWSAATAAGSEVGEGRPDEAASAEKALAWRGNLKHYDCNDTSEMLLDLDKTEISGQMELIDLLRPEERPDVLEHQTHGGGEQSSEMLRYRGATAHCAVPMKLSFCQDLL